VCVLYSEQQVVYPCGVHVSSINSSMLTQLSSSAAMQDGAPNSSGNFSSAATFCCADQACAQNTASSSSSSSSNGANGVPSGISQCSQCTAAGTAP
jgi:hypothetical protein